jgi:hypothetical protein
LYSEPRTVPHDLFIFLLTPVGLNFDPQRPQGTTKGRIALLIYSAQKALILPLIILNLLSMVFSLIWG